MNSSEPENRSRPASLHSQAQHRQGRPGREGDRWGVRAGLARSQPSQERPDSDQPRLAQGQPTSRERPLTDHYPPQASPLQWTPYTPLISDNKSCNIRGEQHSDSFCQGTQSSSDPCDAATGHQRKGHCRQFRSTVLHADTQQFLNSQLILAN